MSPSINGCEQNPQTGVGAAKSLVNVFDKQDLAKDHKQLKADEKREIAADKKRLANDRKDVRNRAAVLVRDVDNRHAVDRPGVERLAARRGIERGPVERHGRAAVVHEHAGDDSVETTAVRVCVIDPGGHAASADAAGRSK